MEVDLFAVSPRQHKASSRAKKSLATSLAMQRFNERRALRYHVQLVNANFKSGDFVWTGTYNDKSLPECRERADKDFGNFITRLYRYCKAHGIQRPKWVSATEYTTEDEKNGVLGRYHHHAIFERVPGLTRDVLEMLWGERGLTRCEYLQTDHGSAESLVNYISKNKKCDRSWRQSRGLKKPVTPPPNDSRWSRNKVEKASTMYIDDAAYWEKLYPGYSLNRVETTVSEAGYRHTTVILCRADAWHDRRGVEIWAGDNRRDRRFGRTRI
jgi:hypothetical protein